MNDRRTKAIAGITDSDGSTFRFTATVLEPDRDNELIPPSALRTENFMKNPIMDWGHAAVYGEGPNVSVVAKVTDLEIKENSMEGLAEWWETNPFAALVADGYRKGFLNAFSITFMADSWRDPNEEEMAKWPNQLGARSVLESGELLTISPVLVGSNRGAMYARGYGFLADMEESKSLVSKLATLENRMQELEKQLKGMPQGYGVLDFATLEHELELASAALKALNSRR